MIRELSNIPGINGLSDIQVRLQKDGNWTSDWKNDTVSLPAFALPRYKCHCINTVIAVDGNYYE